MKRLVNLPCQARPHGLRTVRATGLGWLWRSETFALWFRAVHDRLSYNTKQLWRLIMRRKLFVFWLLLVTALALSATMVLAADMFSGTWKVNVAKSKYSPGPPPKSNMQKIESVAAGMKVVTDGENAEGKKTHNEYTVMLD